jgi:outer membrane protein assembly factor BamB
VRRELESIEILGEHNARERTWGVVNSAFAERQPAPRASHLPRVAAIAVAVAAVAAAALSSPGRAVLDEVREVVGIERAQPALFSLPAPGRLLVASDAGLWMVQADGSKRLLGEYREASWSPFGRFVVAVRENELAALEPDGNVRWTLERPGVRFPRWTGSETDTRIAYVDRTGIRVVAGDGTGDRVLVPGGRGPIAWRPGAGFVLANTTSRSVLVLDAQTGRRLWTAARPRERATAVEWSSDGRRLLVLSPHHLGVYDQRGRILDHEDPAESWPDVDATFRPGSQEIGAARVHGSQSTAYVLTGRTLFNGMGVFRDIAWSPDGTWLLVTWPTADQWVFVRSDARRIQAVSNIAEQFRSRTFPRVEGWCCTP